MAQHTTIETTPNQWTLLTDANVSSATFQSQGLKDIFIQATSGATAPTSSDGALLYRQFEGERNVALADLFPGTTANRIWAKCAAAQNVQVSHA